MIKSFLSKILQLLFVICFFFFVIGCGKENNPPNIILILTDDQGYGDLGCYGAEGFKTPYIDGMAREGALFTDFYVSQAVCSASRASLMTGSYSERVGIQGALSPWDASGLDPNTETLAKFLKHRGYINGIFGKWHLGHREKYLPLQNGFDEYAGLICSNDMWPVDYDGSPLNTEKRSYYPPMYFWEGNNPKEEIKNLTDQSQLTTKITKYALDFIDKNKNNPFFLYLPHPMPHQPIAVSEKFKGKSELGLYGDVIMEIDWSVGQILKSLKKNKIEQNTLIIYVSDNGPWLNFGKWGGSAGPLREGKGTMWEGGVRVPCIIRWPEQIESGQVFSNIAGTIDIFPTLAEIVGEYKIKQKIDGISLLPLLKGIPNANPRNELFYYYGEKLIAVRKGDWKLVFPHSYRSYENVEPGKNLYPGPYGKGEAGLELYNLDNDIGERNNIIENFPLIVTELEVIGERARNILGDKLTNRIGSESYSVVCGTGPSINTISHMGKGKSLDLINSANIKYPGEGTDALINGLVGTIDYKDPSWIGFEAEDVIATVDLGSIKKINFVEARFLQSQIFWIFLPKKVQIEYSIDGVFFELLYEVLPKNDYSFEQKIFKYNVKPLNVKSRFIRIKANNLNQCPDYHPGSGGKSWLFTDEIVIN